METITLFVKEATSEKPIRALEAIIIAMDGVERALVDTTDGEVKITFNEKVLNQEQLIERIRQDGFHII